MPQKDQKQPAALLIAAIIGLIIVAIFGASSRNSDDVDSMPSQMPTEAVSIDIADAVTIEDIQIGHTYCAVNPEEDHLVTFTVTNDPRAVGEELNSLVIPTDDGDIYAISIGLLRKSGPEFTIEGACPSA